MKNWQFYKNSININGQFYSSEELLKLETKGLPDWEKEYFSFINTWINTENYIEVKTSGSTGNPKIIRIHKNTFYKSALNTGNFLGLSKHNTALLCLPGTYIAGKMMIVRAFVLGLKLYWQKPSSTPRIDRNYDFSAFTPMQLQNLIHSNKNLLNRINKLIIGGAPVSKTLIKEISTLDTQILETYGMTETASHIALKNISKGETYFETLNGIIISKDHRDCLTISSKYLEIDDLITNDIVDIKNCHSFKWLGRIDNVINSGGVKLIPEQIEEKLKKVINKNIIIFAEDNDKLSQNVALLIESNESIENDIFKEVLHRYEIPKNVYYLPEFAYTNSKKINRTKTIQKLNQSQQL